MTGEYHGVKRLGARGGRDRDAVWVAGNMRHGCVQSRVGKRRDDGVHVLSRAASDGEPFGPIHNLQ